MKFALIRTKKGASRSYCSGITIYTRKSPKMKKNIRLNYKRFLTKRLAIFIKTHFYDKRKSDMGLVKFSNGAYTNIAIPLGLLPGALIKSTNIPPKIIAEYSVGDSVLLYYLNKKSIFFNVWSYSSNKVVFAKAAGTFCTFIDSDWEKEHIRVKIPSGEIKLIYSQTFVTLGQNSNVNSKLFVTGKAGDNVIIGRRPSVRGVAMNPVDHPNGGRTKSNSPEKTPWGKIAKRNK